jgi:hypothetical protein
MTGIALRIASVVQVEAGSEPSLFTSNFQGWKAGVTAAYVDPYEAKLAALRADKAKSASSLPKGPLLAAAHPASRACTHCSCCWCHGS